MNTWKKCAVLGLLLAACVPDEATGPDMPGIRASITPGTVTNLRVTDGWNSVDLKTLVQDGKVMDLYATDFVFYDIGAGGYLSLDFANIPTDATVQKVRVRAVMLIDPTEAEIPDPEEPCGVYPYEPCETLNPSTAFLQVGGGSLITPFVAMETKANVGLAGNTTVAWDVTAWVNTAARVNDLKLVIRNMDPTGEGDISIDRAWIEVTYGPTPAPVPMNWKVTLFPTDGWDPKDFKTLSENGKLGEILVAEPSDPTGYLEQAVYPIEMGYYLTLKFNGIPSGATVGSTKVRIAWSRGEGAEGGEGGEPPEPCEPPEPGEFPEPCGDTGFPGSALLEVGYGGLTSPSPVLSRETEVPYGESSLTWDVTAKADVSSEVNALKLIITNNDFSGETLDLNQAYLEVTFGTPGPLPGQPFTLLPTAAWDETGTKFGKFDKIRTLDGNAAPVEAGRYLAIAFGDIPKDSTVKSVKVHVTYSTESGFTAGSTLWQVGGGTRSSPFVAMEHRPQGLGSSVTWDVTSWVRTAPRVNDLKLTIRNLDPLGKKVMVDRAHLEVIYGPTPPKSTTGFPVTLFVTDGWDSKDGTNLVQTGTLSVVNSSDGNRDEIASGSFASYQFVRVPGNAVIQGAKVYVQHYEELGFAAGGVVWRVGGGSLTSPTTLSQRIPVVLSGEPSEATVPWGVGAVINTAALLNDLKFVVRNKDALGKKAKINRVYVVVTHQEP